MRIIPRSEWGAAPPKSRTTFSLPVGRFFVHHSVTEPTGDAAADVRALQRIAFGRGFADISYSFVVHPNGQLFEGRGWGVVGAHTEGYNSSAHAVVLIGNYENMQPTTPQLDAIRWLIAEGRRLNKHSSGVLIQPHRAVGSTACPGRNTVAKMDYIKTPIVVTPTPAPPTGGPIFGPITEDTVQPIIIKGIKLDNEGRGYYDVPVNKEKVVSILLNGADPAGGGYKPIVEFAALGFAGMTRVVMEGGLPGGAIDFTVWVTK